MEKIYRIINDSCTQLSEKLPSINAINILNALGKTNSEQALKLINAILTWQTPFIFQSNQSLNQGVRQIICDQLFIGHSDVYMVGSSFLGYKLNTLELGKPFNHKSDIDFCIVSPSIFDGLLLDFRQWISDIRDRQIRPSSKYELNIWIRNIELLDKTIRYGFINNWFIPKCYATSKRVNVVLENTNNYLLNHGSLFKSRKMTIRVYRNKLSLLKQVNYSANLLYRNKNIM